MKQHITPDQLNELSDAGKVKLKKWWKPEIGHWVYEKTWKDVFCITDNSDGYNVEIDQVIEDIAENGETQLYPLLSIGQMIEFLDDHHPDKRYKRGKSETISFHQKRGVYEDWEDSQWYIVPEFLCDDLWQAVKEVLEKK